MKGFISYSHQDSEMLARLHVHLAHIKREGVLTSWTDEEIPAGSDLNYSISRELTSSQLFIALLSPDYIASNYCYDKEFAKAIEMQNSGEIIIIPIILEPCEWLNTPFKQFKALPKDGKAVSEWQNLNNAFLDITQNIRKLLEPNSTTGVNRGSEQKSSASLSRNYRVKRDFDTIQKLEFVETSFLEIKDILKRYLDEIIQIDDNIKFRLIKTGDDLEYILVNRNKIGTESHLRISTGAISPFNSYKSNEKEILYSINQNNGRAQKGFTLSFDDYHMFWSSKEYSYNQENKELKSKDIADLIWNEWLESVGIL